MLSAFCFNLDQSKILSSVKVPIAPKYKGVCLQNTSKPIHTILKYGDCYDFMDR